MANLILFLEKRSSQLLFFYMKTIKHKKVKKKRDLAHKFEHCYLQYKGLCRILKSLKTSAIFK